MVICLVDHNSLFRRPIIIRFHLRDLILEQFVLLRRAVPVLLIISQIRIVLEVQARLVEILIARATIVFYDVGIAAGSVWWIVHILEWPHEFCRNGGLKRNFGCMRERILVRCPIAFAEWFWLHAAITHDNVSVTTGAVTSVGRELLVISSI